MGSLPANSFGFLLTSQTQNFVPNPGGSLGNLCMSGNIGRFVGPGQIMSSGSVGEWSLALDLTQIPQGATFASVIAGETWNYQGWYRDITPGGAQSSNFTPGLEITYR